MENPDANQLPEVDSLPDGFVESSTEALAPLTPSVEQERPLDDYKQDNIPEIDSSNESRHELSANEFQECQGRAEKTQKLRTFPVQLSETDNFDASVDLVEVSGKGRVEQTEGTPVIPNSANSVSDASPAVLDCCEVKEQNEAQCQSSERSTEGGLDAPKGNTKETCSRENADASKNRKPETTETKRKSVKRTFKSEKEFLEFTLKYQQVLAERDAAIAVRDKLESLCRELQRQNKILMDECKRVSTEGQSLRLDLSAKFQDAIKDVGNKLEEQKDECLSQLKENEMLRSNLKQLADQYALSEQQHAQRLKQKELELQIADLKIKQHEEKLVQEQSQMKLYAEQVSQLLATEKNLRLQLTADGEKFQQFQDALLKSNEVFETFKQEIEKMAKSIKELKKENLFLKNKTDKSDITLIELVDEREQLKKRLERTRNQKEKLESLCRSLQAERKENSGSNSSDSVAV
nr:beta-taxilin isoform X1 [Ziziphus jujuba var. spinosa]